jgi:hypothetical protein
VQDSSQSKKDDDDALDADAFIDEVDSLENSHSYKKHKDVGQGN